MLLDIDLVHGWLIPLGAFVATLALAWLALRTVQGKRKPVDLRLEKISPEESDQSDEPRGVLGSLAPALAAQIPESKKERRDFQQLLRGAGLYSPHAATWIYAARFVLLLVPLVTAGVLAVASDGTHTFGILVLGGLVAAALSIVPRLYVFFRRRRRVARIRQALPDAMDMLSMCTSGGMSLGTSLEQVSRQLTAHRELAEELRILRRQAEMGSLSRALADFASRVDIVEARQLANLLTRGDRLGTGLAGSLHTQADHLRVRRKQLAIQRANKAPVKLVFPLMFCFAPAALILLTAPAALELKEFLAPSKGNSILSVDADVMSPSGLIGVLESLDQDMNAGR
ncbi:MAG: type II secretion system F family protein [Pirellulales bacterium]|nr:type II secretion system F family protein [Pirellulales bacterium]